MAASKADIEIVEANECLAFAFVEAVEADAVSHGDIVTGVLELVLLPLPNWPQVLSPQHRTVPPPRSAQLWCHHPAVTPVAPVIPLTAAGVVLFAVVPFPSCPNWPCPQHWTVPFPSSAQECRHPALTSTAPVIPTTCTGVVESRSTRCRADRSRPPPSTAPCRPLSTAHVWTPPPLTATAVVMPLTGRTWTSS